MKKIFLFILLSSPFLSLAQNADKVMLKAIIHYQKKSYIIKYMEDQGMDKSPWFSRMKDKLPKVLLTDYTLYYNMNSSYYSKSDEQTSTAGDKMPPWFQQYAATNDVYLNFDENKVVEKKPSMGKEILIKDDLPKIDWKLTDEFLTIAGYPCRKATAMISDSLYVIAFYSDALYTPTGPEHFSGLPGAILGIAIPRFHMNIMATKVEGVMFDDSKIQIPSKGKEMTYDELHKMLFDMGEKFRPGSGTYMAWSIWM